MEIYIIHIYTTKTKTKNDNAKVPFFFRDNFRKHSSTKIWKKCFFWEIGKKNIVLNFFREIVYQPLTQLFWAALLIIKRKSWWLVFFRPLLAWFFFPWKSFISLTHSSEKAVFCFLRPPGKTMNFSLTH